VLVDFLLLRLYLVPKHFVSVLVILFIFLAHIYFRKSLLIHFLNGGGFHTSEIKTLYKLLIYPLKDLICLCVIFLTVLVMTSPSPSIL